MLQGKGTSIETVAIPWLHVIREHPTFLKNYENLFADQRKKLSVQNQIITFFRNKLKNARNFLTFLLRSNKIYLYKKLLPKKVDFLFVSHAMSLCRLSRSSDFYFGQIPQRLKEKGFSVLIALLNHTGYQKIMQNHSCNKHQVPRIILADFLRFQDEAKFYFRLRNESKRLKKAARNQTRGLLKKILLRASEEALSKGAFDALRIGSQIEQLIKRTRAKTIILTHEGHAWERVAFAMAKKANPDVRCVGYQHSAIFRLQHAIKRDLSMEYNPDIIVTAGYLGKKQLERLPGFKDKAIRILGSPRCAQSNSNRFIRRDKNKRTCLVLPEGILSECMLLFEFSLGYANYNPEFNFIWRLHPIINYQDLFFKNRKLKKLPRNIEISKKSITDDMANSDYVLYRGSTAAVQAVALGLIPIYLIQKNELVIDPLYQHKKNINRVQTLKQFHRVVTSKKYEAKNIKKLKSYALKIFTSPNESVLIENNTDQKKQKI